MTSIARRWKADIGATVETQAPELHFGQAQIENVGYNDWIEWEIGAALVHLQVVG
jgi:hypothetical protein